MSNWGPIPGYGRLDMLAYDKWVGTQGFWCTAGSEAATAAKIRHSVPHPLAGDIGTYEPVCQTVEIHAKRLSVSKSLLIARYATGRVAGKGKVRVLAQAHSATRHKDFNGKVIQGPANIGTTEAPYWVNYDVLRGDPRAIEATATYILETAVEPSGIQLETGVTIENYRGKINSNTLSNFPATHAYTLLYIGANIVPNGMSDLVYVDHVFLYNKRGWINDLEVQQSEWVIQQEAILTKDGVPAVDADGNMRTRDVKQYRPSLQQDGISVGYDENNNPFSYYTYKDSDVEGRTLYESVSFTDFNSMVVW